MKKTKTRNKLSKEEIKKRREDTNFRRKISTTFIKSGFDHIKTNGREFEIGQRTVELDYVFLYENILIIIEDTCGSDKGRHHIRNKNEAFSQINDNKTIFYTWLKNTFSEQWEKLSIYREERIKIYYLYLSKKQLNLTKDKILLYNIMKFVEPQTLDYFHSMSQSIHHSARFEIFRYLDLKDEDIGIPSSSDTSSATVKAPIICPENITGLRNDVRIISFMMSAKQLLKMSYVLRKDNWEDSMFLYQRLLDKNKVKNIRKFIAERGEAFYNNIIVGLPDDISFLDESKSYKRIEEIGDFERCKLVIPEELNSICVIDGQHRIYAHYEGIDALEDKISRLRNELHLLVTGLIFPKDMPEIKRNSIQSSIFLDINSNAKQVQADVLLHIKMMKEPFSDIGLARLVIKKLNDLSAFSNKFEMSTLEKGKIKIASIIKFALRYLVTLKPSEGKVSLYDYWDGDKEGLKRDSTKALNDYVEFCASCLDAYFSAIRKSFNDEWKDSNSKLLTVISINGFIIAYTRQLKKNGPKSIDFYSEKLNSFEVNFARDKFPYTSSQYRKFSTMIIEKVFDMTD